MDLDKQGEEISGDEVGEAQAGQPRFGPADVDHVGKGVPEKFERPIVRVELFKRRKATQRGQQYAAAIGGNVVAEHVSPELEVCRWLVARGVTEGTVVIRWRGQSYDAMYVDIASGAQLTATEGDTTRASIVKFRPFERPEAWGDEVEVEGVLPE